MKSDWQRELETAIGSDRPLEEIVALLRQFKEKGVTQEEAYSFLVSLREKVSDEATDDRILEVADFVAGFCSPHVAVWDK
jgi:hypothetical protein